MSAMVFNMIGGAAGDTTALVETLALFGITAPAGADLDALTALVRTIRTGDLTAEVFLATVSPAAYPTGTSYQYLHFSENAYPSEVISVTGSNRVSNVTVRLTAHDCILDDVAVTAPGWTVTPDAAEDISEIAITRAFSASDNHISVLDALEAITINAADDASFYLAVSAVGMDSGDVFLGTGSCFVSFQRNSWAEAESVYPAWSSVEGKTWTQMENMVAE